MCNFFAEKVGGELVEFSEDILGCSHVDVLGGRLGYELVDVGGVFFLGALRLALGCLKHLLLGVVQLLHPRY